MLYAWLKLAHLLSLVLWIGPPLGAYYALVCAHGSGDRERIVWVERITERVLVAEHVALVFVVATGVALVQIGPWQLFGTPWLRTKLLMFLGVLAFEAFDMWLAHRFMTRLLACEDPLSHPEWGRAERLRRWLIVAAIPVGLVLVPGMFLSAVLKS